MDLLPRKKAGVSRKITLCHMIAHMLEPMLRLA